MMNREELESRFEWAAEEGLDIYFADGFDEAILGYDLVNHKVAYSYSKMVEVLMSRDHISEEEAEEYIDYNFVGFNEQKVLVIMDN